MIAFNLVFRKKKNHRLLKVTGGLVAPPPRHCRGPTALAVLVPLRQRRARRTRPRPPGPPLRRLACLPPATTALQDRPPRSAPRCVPSREVRWRGVGGDFMHLRLFEQRPPTSIYLA